jgi:hypothetical protein
LLSLQWKDVKVRTGPTNQRQMFLRLPAHKAKTNATREVLADQRLSAVLDMRRHGPDGRELGSDRYVFGNEVGERLGRVYKAWQTTVLKAHGQKPQWVKGTRNLLTPESRASYRAINLHFHDLRAEFGTRIVESGSSLVEARDLLGHTNLTQTSSYLRARSKAVAAAIERKEAYEREQARARAAERENCHKETECDNPQVTTSEMSSKTRGISRPKSDGASTGHQEDEMSLSSRRATTANAWCWLSEMNSYTSVECDNPVPPMFRGSASVEVVRH